MSCYRCGLDGHNCSKCPNSGVPDRGRPPKKAKTGDSQSVGGCEGVSERPKRGRKPRNSKKSNTTSEFAESQDIAGPSQPSQSFDEWERYS